MGFQRFATHFRITHFLLTLLQSSNSCMPQLCIFRMNILCTKNVNNFHYKKKTDLNFLILDYKISRVKSDATIWLIFLLFLCLFQFLYNFTALMDIYNAIM